MAKQGCLQNIFMPWHGKHYLKYFYAMAWNGKHYFSKKYFVMAWLGKDNFFSDGTAWQIFFQIKL